MSMMSHASKLSYYARTLRQMITGNASSHDRRLVKQALSRIDSQTYGYCLHCGMNIPEGELERKPERQHCPRCETD